MSEADSWQPPTPPEFTNSDFMSPIESEPKAGFWIRVAARFCDAFNSIPVAYAVIAIAMFTSDNYTIRATAAIIGFILAIAVLGYWTGTQGGSPLRVRLGVYVVDQKSGSFLGAKRGIIRAFVSAFFSLVSIVSFLDILSMLWNPNKQTWHDKIAESVVVKR